ncbi:MAG: carboxypeptidase M32 [Rhodobacteraceae bacterium]|nr:carboxypeptidase M32 [Paracoccaceae bacterium]
MSAFAELMAFQRETEALALIAGRLEWDQETVMPPGAAQQRGEESAALAGVIHARRTDPRIGDWLAAAEAPDAAGQRALELIARAHRRNGCIPARLAAEIARVTSLAQGIWAAARAADDVARFLPTLRNVVALKREAGQALAAGGFGADAYDALIDEYEPGMTAARLAAMFGRMRPRLVALREAVLGAERRPKPLEGLFPKEAQLAFARELADAFGYDWARGRLDLAVHPFSSGQGEDVRITTRVVETEPFNCFYSTIHEVGHACYEQGIDAAHRLTPLGQGVSMGVHESQSRIYENQLGRSRAFTGWMWGRMRDIFGPLRAADAAAFWGTVNRVHSGFIRTEADEVHYNLHVMLRFDLERELIGGGLEVEDLEAAWNDRFHRDFGVVVDRPANGMLQDVHWSVGAIGYFPTYSLGNVYAGCLHRALRADLPELDASLAQGDARPATAWLREKVQRTGGLYDPAATIARACGFAPTEEPLLDYLEAKFGEIYGLS